MPRNRMLCRWLGLTLTAVVLPAAPAAADEVTGGLQALERPEIKKVQCVAADGAACERGDLVRVRGEGLAAADRVVFLGTRGRSDDRPARPRSKKPHAVTVRVPAGARSGPVKVTSRRAGASAPAGRLEVARAAVAPLSSASADGAFPVAGKHHYGTEVNRFGGGRGHKGQDVLADCGVPLVAALGGKVTFASTQSRAGHYVVIRADDGTGQAYMHMRRPSTLEKGDRVEAGQRIGEVGDTGAASACHLHFELWTAPGWYAGGEAVDPLAFLKALDTKR